MQRVCAQLEHASDANKKMEADKLVTDCIYLRDQLESNMKRNLKKIKSTIEIALSRLGGMPIDGNETCALTALCGDPKHMSTGELYFQTGYNF